MRIFNKKAAILIIGTLWLFGCLPEMSSPTAGIVIDHGLATGQDPAKGSKNFKIWKLTKDQLDWLYSWSQNHQSDWGMVLATPPEATYTISVHHADGTRTQIDMYSLNESWTHTISLLHFSQDGKFITGEQMNLPAEDIAQLKAALREKAE